MAVNWNQVFLHRTPSLDELIAINEAAEAAEKARQEQIPEERPQTVPPHLANSFARHSPVARDAMRLAMRRRLILNAIKAGISTDNASSIQNHIRSLKLSQQECADLLLTFIDREDSRYANTLPIATMLLLNLANQGITSISHGPLILTYNRLTQSFPALKDLTSQLKMEDS